MLAAGSAVPAEVMMGEFHLKGLHAYNSLGMPYNPAWSLRNLDAKIHLFSGIQMSSLFGLKEEIEKDEFIKRWEDSERKKDKAGRYDGSAHENLEHHKTYQGLKYFRVTLTEEALNNLVLPCHNHVNNEVGLEGEPFWRVISKYSARIQEGASDDCLQRLDWIKHNIMKFPESEGMVEAEFMFVSNEGELAMRGYHMKDYGENKLYAGNFHQFVTYGLWIKENGYKPTNTYYCERN